MTRSSCGEIVELAQRRDVAPARVKLIVASQINRGHFVNNNHNNDVHDTSLHSLSYRDAEHTLLHTGAPSAAYRVTADEKWTYELGNNGLNTIPST